MKTKVNCKHGMIVDSNGNILHAWAWYSGGSCPYEFDMPKDGIIIELTEEEHFTIHRELHVYKYDKAQHSIELDGTKRLLTKKDPGHAGAKQEDC